ncbi:MAG: hypothetical protein NBV68_07695 [Erythrobacter sp.]|uniref:hypothetical protein n=1 Tax=Erythrobacter sp. TaxID=1042 RepID=UPI0025D2BC90|nr:hypothetical protein [Erythrobacter sp.]MCL9999249.1 hypothetical protein [Erythrobacter sp.]
MPIFAAALASAAAVAVPAPVPLPEYEPGDAFVFSDGRVERVVEAGEMRMTWAGLSGARYKRSRNFVVPVLEWRSGRATGRREVHGNPDALWPIGSGKGGGKSARFRVVTETKANSQAASRRSVSLWVCKTGKLKLFTVAAGTYEAIPVKCDRYSPTTMRLLEQREWDYAPDLGHYVRRVTVNYLRGTTRKVELVAALSGPSASKARLAALARAARQSARIGQR